MDLNYLFHRQQVERYRSESARSGEARHAHALLAALYEAKIQRLTNGRIRFDATHREPALAVAA